MCMSRIECHEHEESFQMSMSYYYLLLLPIHRVWGQLNNVDINFIQYKILFLFFAFIDSDTDTYMSRLDVKIVLFLIILEFCV